MDVEVDPEGTGGVARREEGLCCPWGLVESETAGLSDSSKTPQKPLELWLHSVGRSASVPARCPEIERGQLSKIARKRFCSSPRPAFRTFAHRKFMEGFDVVILGHSHFPEAVEEWVDGRKCLYFNVGDWAVHRSFLRFTPPDQFRLERFVEKKQGEGDGD